MSWFVSHVVLMGNVIANNRLCFWILIFEHDRGQAEKEFKVEVEVIGRVRHKNLVRLLGYCVEGAYR